MKRYLPLLLSVAALLIAALSAAGHAGAGAPRQVTGQEGAPTVISYQGQVTVDGKVYDGAGHFKFAIIASDGQTTWSNDSTSVSGSEPNASVALTVTNGLFTVLLGDTSLGMSQITYIAFATPDTHLRVWFSADGLAFQQLEPDRQIAAVPYAMQAEVAKQVQMVGGYPADALAPLGHKHAGQDIYSGTVSAAFIDPAIARFGQITPTVWSNAGPGSGLNADLIDGQNAAAFVTVDGSQTISGLKTFSPASGAPFSVTSSVMVSNLNADLLDGQHANALRPVMATAAYQAAADLTPSCLNYVLPPATPAAISIATSGAGTIIVEANAYATLSNDVSLTLAMSTNPGDCGTSTDVHPTRWFTGPPYYGSGFFTVDPLPYSMNLTFQVRRSCVVSGPGTYTYYLNGQASNATIGNNSWLSADLLAQYYP
jgi:hypothetical protein